MKVYRKIIISICIVIAVFLTAILCINTTIFKTLVTGNYPSQEEYSLWEEYSVEVAKNLDEKIITDKEVIPSYDIGNDVVTVIIRSLKYGITIEATYPVDYIKKQNGKLEMQIDYENAKYIEYYENLRNFGTNKILAFIVNILAACFFGGFFAFCIYAIFYKIPNGILDIVQSIKSKKKQNN